MIRIPVLALLLAFLPALLDRTPTFSAETPHVVFILVDDMGYGDLGAYNENSKIPTPHLDRLASSGLRFLDAHAAGPLCHVSRYGLLTGRYPFRAEVHRWRERPTIEPGQATIASLLKSRGYHTSMVGKWHLGFDEKGYDRPLGGGPVDRGFDDYFGIRASTDIPPYFYIRGDRAIEAPTGRIEASNSEGWSPIQGKFWRAGGISPDLELEEVMPRFTSEAIRVIENHSKERASQPLFLYLAYPAPHTPWLPSEKFVGKSGAGMYGDFMMMVDDEIGQVLESLEKTGLAKDALVIFSSDNGPTWYDRDVERFGHDSAAGFRGMKADAWEAGHRMPFIARWPGKIRPGSQSDQLISFVDVFATLAELTGAKREKGDGPDSQSFLPALLGKPGAEKTARTSLIVKASGQHFSVRQGPWKLITALGSGGFSKPRRIEPEEGGPTGQLYHLGNDPAESKNLYAERPEIVARLLAFLEKEKARS